MILATVFAVVFALAGAADEWFPVKWRDPPVPKPGTQQYDAVAAAYALRTPEAKKNLRGGGALVREVYGRDFTEDCPERLVVLDYDAARDPDGRPAAVQKFVDVLEPGDVIRVVNTDGVKFISIYAGDVYGHRRSHILHVNRFGRVIECCFGTTFLDWGKPFRLRCAAKFTVIRPLLERAVPISAKRDFPKGVGIKTDDERLSAVLALAWARYLKTVAIQYDCLQMVSSQVARRRPGYWDRTDHRGRVDAATADTTGYTVCSSFTYDVFYEAFGYGIGDEGGTGHFSFNLTRNPPPDILVYSYRKSDARPMEQVEAEVRALLRPGDVIAYCFMPPYNGHVVLYIGEVDGIPTVLHSQGGQYDFESGHDLVEYEGTMNKDDAENLLLSRGCGHYLPGMYEFSVVRPLQHAGLALTPSGAARASHPRFRYERRVKGGRYGSVISGGELVYGIELFNADLAPCDATVRETLPEGVTLLSVSKGCRVSGRSLVWPITLAPGQRRIVNWRVKVTAKPGARIVAEGGSAGGLPSNRLETDVVAGRISVAAAFDWARRNLSKIGDLPDCRVDGWIGGRETDELQFDRRVRETRSRDLQTGDVVASLVKREGARAYRIWVKDKRGLVEQEPSGTLRNVPESEVGALLAADFFAAFRPARYLRR